MIYSSHDVAWAAVGPTPAAQPVKLSLAKGLGDWVEISSIASLLAVIHTKVQCNQHFSGYDEIKIALVDGNI
jgi:hypothetical protein